MKTEKMLISLLVMFVLLTMLNPAIAQLQTVRPMTPYELDLYERILHEAAGHPELTVESGVEQIIGPPEPIIIYRLNCLDQGGKRVIVTFRHERGSDYYKINNRDWRKLW